MDKITKEQLQGLKKTVKRLEEGEVLTGCEEQLSKYTGELTEALERIKELEKKQVILKGKNADLLVKLQEENPRKYKDSEPYEITCPACKQTFESEMDFAQHWTKEHQEKYGPYKSEEYKNMDKQMLALDKIGLYFKSLRKHGPKITKEELAKVKRKKEDLSISTKIPPAKTKVANSVIVDEAEDLEDQDWDVEE